MSFPNPQPPEDPEKRKKRIRWTCFNQAALIIAAIMILIWNFSQPSYVEAGQAVFPRTFALLLIPASFLTWVPAIHENGSMRLLIWLWVAGLFIPNLWAWIAHGESLFGYEAHWALGIYCVIATYFFVRVFGRFLSLISDLFDTLLYSGDDTPNRHHH